MQKTYYTYATDGRMLSTLYLTPKEAATQENITDIEPPQEAGKVPWFIDRSWQLRDIVVQEPGHAERRAQQYPSVADQLDMLWHAMNRGELPMASDFFEVIKSVKDAHPKPTDAAFEVGRMPE